jgi:hypothetical protein
VIYSDTQYDGCKNEFSGKIVSIVGPYISYHTSDGGYCEGAAHPYAYQTFGVRDIRTGKKP